MEEKLLLLFRALHGTDILSALGDKNGAFVDGIDKMDIVVSPMDALKIIDDCIVQGYQTKDAIAAEFKTGVSVDSFLNKWREMEGVWTNNTINILSKVFASPVPLYNFRDARPPFGATSLDVRYVGIVDRIVARINKLNEYHHFLQSQFNVKPAVITVSGNQSRVNIGSVDESINIMEDLNSNFDKLRKLIENDYQKEDKEELARSVEQIKQACNDRSKLGWIKEKMGGILSRTADISSISSLVITILQMLPKV